MAWYKDSPAVFALTYTNENEEANDHHALSQYRFPSTPNHTMLVCAELYARAD